RTVIYTLSLHDALPIYPALLGQDLRDFHQMRLGDAKSFCNFTDGAQAFMVRACINKHAQCIVSKCGEAHRCKASQEERDRLIGLDRKSTRLNSSHVKIS